MNEWKPDFCIYHGGCDDGFGAAYSIQTKWPDVEFVGGVHGKGPPDVTNKNVIIVDFSYPASVLTEMAKTAKSIFVLDHHKTAEAALATFPQLQGDLNVTNVSKAFETEKIVVHFDMSHSGAYLAWSFCRGTEYIPEMIKLIEDQDLWKFNFKEVTKNFTASLRTYPQSFDVWKAFEDDAHVQRACEEGRIINKSYNANVASMLNEARFVHLSGFFIPTVNAPYHYASDTANQLLTKFPEAPFAMTYFIRADGMVQGSLRSDDTRVDVSAIAKLLGGGGHRNAAGFQLTLAEAKEWLL